MRGITRRELVRSAGVAGVGLAARRLLGQGGAVGTGGGLEASRVTAPAGDLRGRVVADGVRVFKGVPFAEPPVGPLRFRPTVAARRWTGVREAAEFRPMAIQTVGGKVSGSEDCLYLNVWAPAGKGPFPVFVWIHGGGFTGGAATAPIFDGTGFAQGGVVLVTVAYRLGVFGFMDLEPLLGTEYAGSGNNAMRDLVMSLRWVRENIAAFGGDPGRVTIGGESAGATAALMAIGEARGLFQSAISESGGGERVWSGVEAAAVAAEYGAAWRNDATAGGGRSPAVAELKTASAARLIEVQTKVIAETARHFPFRSEVDGRYLTRRPVDAVAMGSAKGKRLLLGTNRDESAAFLGPHPGADPTSRDLGNLSLAKFDEVFAKYPAVYPGMSPEERRIRAVTAEEYWVPSVRLADAQVGAGGRAWMYRLDYANRAGKYAGEAYHAEDLRLVFERPDAAEDAEGAALGRRMHAAWIAFIKGDAPAAEGLPVWPEYRIGARRTMIFDRVCRVEERPAEAELRLWDGVM